ncbi:hypothetical protein [Micromonospora sp. NBC_01813]|uniref:hypothetical protein n=1 Tax=Micromonospora sp. NBC_01813 TaxID=2975988 RepID=UPI002DDA1D56|nr:hypothetical protein [Micromonospora sp. NBC_01813]WSA10808.1 hypothetical protein OG958_08515 [Micromonospora sp. NBC_01813]
MSQLQLVTGPVTGAAVVAALAVYAASVLLRERRGGGARVTDLATSRPYLTAMFVLAGMVGVVLLVLRLGALS